MLSVLLDIINLNEACRRQTEGMKGQGGAYQPQPQIITDGPNHDVWTLKDQVVTDWEDQ